MMIAFRALRYKSLRELRDAYEAGELSQPVQVDWDAVVAYQGEERVFSAHPDDVLFDSLELLGIPADCV